MGVFVLVGVAGWILGAVVHAAVAGGRHRYAEERDLPRRPSRWVPPVMAVVGCLVVYAVHAPPLVVLASVVSAWGLVGLTAVDIDVHRLPDVVTLPSYVVLGCLLVAEAVRSADAGSLVRSLLCALVTGGGALLLALLPGQGLGLGDVKLLGSIGMMTGWFGWSTLGVALYACIFAAGIWALGLVLTRRATVRSRIAYGPFLAIGAITALVLATG